MRIFIAGQVEYVLDSIRHEIPLPFSGGRTRGCGEAHVVYVAAENPRRTQPSGKKAIYGWTLPLLKKGIEGDFKTVPRNHLYPHPFRIVALNILN
jgi:hypothetical protein